MLYHLRSSLCTIYTAWLKYGFNQLMDPLIIRNILDGIMPYKSTNNHREASLGVCFQPPIIAGYYGILSSNLLFKGFVQTPLLINQAMGKGHL